jgi:hypothetical protein
LVRGSGFDEIGVQVFDPGAFGAQLCPHPGQHCVQAVSLPFLGAIVGLEVVEERTRAARGQPESGGVADAVAPADPGDHSHPAPQRQGIAGELDFLRLVHVAEHRAPG